MRLLVGLALGFCAIGAGASAPAALPAARRLMAAHHKTACIACCACKHYTKSDDCGFDKCKDGSDEWCWDPARSQNGGYGEYCETEQMYKIGFPGCKSKDCVYKPPVDEHGWTDTFDEQDRPTRQGGNGKEPTDIGY